MAKHNFIKAERMKKNMTQAKFSEYLGIDQPRLSLLERNQFPFRVNFIFTLQKKLRLGADEILTNLSKFNFN